MRNLNFLKKIFFLLLFFTTLLASAQKEAANWYFGEQAGMSFNTSPPTVLTDGLISVIEGSSSISDKDGNLLFYTDGITIYNANHQIMQNGTGLYGHTSTTQSALIVPQPGNPKIYYLFSLDAQAGLFYDENYDPNESTGLSYSVIDMTLDGGLGGVLPNQKNIILETPVTEKITATYHSNRQDIWIISHRMDNDEFTSYLLTNSGLNTTPVISAVGDVHTLGNIGAGAIGYLKFSPDGTKLACAKTYYNRGLELFDFDKSTGIVSNARKLSNKSVYGVEFSSNSKLLYCTTPQSTNKKVVQYNISNPNLSAILDSETILTTGIYYRYYALQLAINGKMYIAQTGNYLSVINDPNIAGLDCDFQNNAVSFEQSYDNSGLGLPNLIQDYFQYEIDFQNLCYGTETDFEVLSYVDLASVSWNFGDPTSGADNSSTEPSPSHIYSNPGDYIVNVDIVTSTGAQIHLTDSLTIQTGQAIFPGNLKVCDENNTGSYVFDLTSQIPQILGGQDPYNSTVTFHTDETDAKHNQNAISNPDNFANTENPQTIYVRVDNPDYACPGFTQFDLEVLPLTPEVPNLKICSNNSGEETIDLTQNEGILLENQPQVEITYFESEADAENNTNPIQNPQTFTPTENPQIIYVQIFHPELPDCYAVISFSIKTDPSPIIEENLQLESCFTTIDLRKIADQLPNELTFTFYETETDAENGLNVIDNPENYLFYSDKTIYLRAKNNADCFTVTELNLKKITCKLPQGISPNGDGKNDSFDLSDLTAASEGGDLKIFSRYGRKVYEKNDYSKEWEGQDLNGNKLPTGTYYYVLKLNKENPEFGRIIKRWVYLQRQSGM